MIRLFIMIGVVGVFGLSYFATIGQGPEFQMTQPTSLYEKFVAEGLVPGANDLSENEDLEHDIFEVPPEDEVQLKKAMANPMGGMKMEGMEMPMGTDGKTPMKMEGEGGMKMPMANEDGTTMKMAGEAEKKMPMANEDGTTMKMAGEAEKKMPMVNEDGTTMKMAGEAEKKMPMVNEDGTTMKMAGETEKKMPMGTESKTPMKMAGDGDPEHAKEEDAESKEEGGLKITQEGAFDREINLTMAEWKFSDLKIDVKKGERVRFNITNGGKIPHEFMFMTMPAMAAVSYRARRADWNLLEHEALYEQSLVLPGGKFSFVAEIKENGAWMFMCMLPYHMQMGMMGQMATPGMAMDMKM